MAHCAGAGKWLGVAGMQGWDVGAGRGGGYFELMTVKGVLSGI